MIAPSRRSGNILAISRHYESSRVQDQTLASAYEALIPVVSRHPKHLPNRRDDREVVNGVLPSPQRSAAGA
jgi:hypothetical protein